jgi:uncharacterized surface protein with fasciclin (FAS1) repeats
VRSKRFMGVAGLAMVAALGLAACSSDSDTSAEDSMATASEMPAPEASVTNTIPEVAAAAGDFTILVDAVTAAGLAETLSTGEYTVFAPTDEAFQPLVDNGTVEELLKDPEGQLTSILTYHVVEGKVTAEDVVKLDGQKVTTVNGDKLKVMVSDSGEVMLKDSSGGTVTVVQTDVEADNGVIHVIDGVLIPKS